MRLDDNATFEAFQLWWYALTLGPARPATPLPRLETEEQLRQKMVAISQADPGGGRVLRKECELELTADERVALVELVARMEWSPEAAPHAAAAAGMLARG